MREDLEFLICICDQLPKGGGFAATLAAYILFVPWSVAQGALSMNPLKGPYICLAASPSVGDANISHLVAQTEFTGEGLVLPGGVCPQSAVCTRPVLVHGKVLLNKAAVMRLQLVYVPVIRHEWLISPVALVPGPCLYSLETSLEYAHLDILAVLAST